MENDQLYSLLCQIEDIPEELLHFELFLYACSFNFENTVVRHLEHFPNIINEQDHNGVTGLLRAISMGNESIAIRLIKKNVNVDLEDHFGNTPLIMACIKSMHSIIELLLEKSLRHVTASNVYNLNPLAYALMSGIKVHSDLLTTPINYDILSTFFGNSLLHYAAIGGNAWVVKFLTEKCTNINHKNSFDKSPLHLALMYGNHDAAQILIERGAKLCISDMCQSGPLHYSATGNTLVLENVVNLSHFMDIEALNSQKLSALHLAILKHGNASEMFVEFLICMGANVNARGVNQNTPLHFAAMINAAEIAKLLIESGAEVDAVNASGNKPLYYAIKSHSLATISILVEHNASYFCSKIKGHALNLAIETKQRKILEFIFENHKSCEIPIDNNVRFYLQIQPFYEDTKFINNWLLHYDSAPLLMKDFYSNSFLHVAAAHCRNEEVTMLLEKFADNIDDLNISGKTALEIAIENRNINAVRSLLKYGANMKRISLNGLTMLDKAIDTNEIEIVKLVLKYQPRFDMQEDQYYLKKACSTSCPKILDIFDTKMKNFKMNYDPKSQTKTILHFAVKQQPIKNILKLINTYGKNNNMINHFDEEGMTCLHHAVIAGRIDLVKCLIANNASFLATTITHKNCLHFAVIHKHIDLVTFFYWLGVSTDAPDSLGWTPMHYAIYNGLLADMIKKGINVNVASDVIHCAAAYSKNIEIIQYLFECGADINKKDDITQYTPIEIAKIFRNTVFLEFVQHYDGYYYRRTIHNFIYDHDINPL